MVKTIAIDPGVARTGWAVFNDAKLFASGTIKGKSSGDICDEVEILILAHSWDGTDITFVIECPKDWQTSRSKAASASGDLMKLAFLTGMLAGNASRILKNGHTKMVETAQWKGQLSKAAVRKRLEKKYTFSEKALDDEVDAIGIGDWWINHGQKLHEKNGL